MLFLSVTLTVVLASCGGSGSPASPSGPVTAPTPTPTPTATTSPGPGPSPSGIIIITVPTPAPVFCVPAPVTISVAQRTVISCREDGYSGGFSSTVADATIASVQLAPGTLTLFYVAGLRVGTTTLSLKSNSGGTGKDVIKVVPNAP